MISSLAHMVGLLLLVTCGLAAAASSSPGPSRVLIIYNSAFTLDGDGDGVQDSLQVANYYALRRGVPSANLLGLSCTTSTSYGSTPAEYTKFVNEVLTPVRNKLAALGPTNIAVLLFCYGTPWTVQGISLDNAMMACHYWRTASDETLNYDDMLLTNPYCESTPGFGADNSYFSHDAYKFKGFGSGTYELYLTCRLDGPRGVLGVLDLVDQARYADRYVSALPGYYNGNIYVDSQNRKGEASDAKLYADFEVQSGSYGSYAATDVNIAYGEHWALSSGLPLKWQKTGDIIGRPGLRYQDGSSAEQAPAALLYGGWYAYNTYLPVVWEWMPGAVACDLNSSSLIGLRDRMGLGWASRALASGATAVCGVVDEPYTYGHTKPNVLIWGMLQGFTFAEASALANPGVAWMSFAVGDPLYAPFRPKTPVKDLRAPVFAGGYPKVVSSNAKGVSIHVVLDDSVEPEVAKVTVEYGPSTALGQSVTSTVYSRQHQLTLSEVAANSTLYYRVTAIDPVGNVKVSSNLSFSSPQQRPYNGITHSIPGTVQCEHFDEGGEGVAYHDNDPANHVSYQFRPDTGVEINTAAPYTILNGESGEWLEYSVNVTQTGQYTAEAYASHGHSPWGGSVPAIIHIEVDGQDVTGPMRVENGNYWRTISRYGVALTQGAHLLQIVFEHVDGKVRRVGAFDYLKFTLMTGDLSAPIISNVAASNITDSKATITWTSNEEATTEIEYGPTSAYGLSATNGPRVTAHTQTLTGLRGSTIYHYRVVSRDVAGNTSVSGNYTFATLPSTDTIPPDISEISVSTASNSAILGWKTNENSDTQVEYGTTSAYGSRSILNSSLVTSHQVKLEALTGSTVYHYRLISRDAAGNVRVTPDATFTTKTGNDVAPPLISNVVVQDVNAEGAQIRWSTNENSNTQVEYGLTTAYGQFTAVDDNDVTIHIATVSGLQPDTTCYFRVLSRDPTGNQSVSGGYSFRTQKYLAGTLQFSAPSFTVNENAAAATITVTRTGGNAGTVSAAYTITNGSATAGLDYTSVNGLITFVNGDSTPKSLTLSILNDSLQERTETINLTLSNPTGGAALGNYRTAVLSIHDDEPVPQTNLNLALANYSFDEGMSAFVPLEVIVTRSGGMADKVSVNYTIESASATAGADFVTQSGTLTFWPDEMPQKSIFITVLDDSLLEGDELFTITLSNPTGSGVLGTIRSSTIRVRDDETIAGKLHFEAASYSVNESSGSMTLRIRRTGGKAGQVSIQYQTVNNSATAESDFSFTSGIIVFDDQDDTPKTITIPILNDTLSEREESFGVSLTHVTGGAGFLHPSTASVTIADDDPQPPSTISVSAFGATENSGPTMVYVSRSGNVAGALTLNYATSNGTATAGADYTAVSGTVSFAAGEAGMKTISIPVLEDSLLEADETFLLTLTVASGSAEISPNPAILAILDNDSTSAGVLQFSAATFEELESRSIASIKVARSGGFKGAVSVSYSTSDGTALGGMDYTSTSGVLNFADGQREASFYVMLKDDSLNEGNESLNLTLSNPTGGALLGAQKTASLTIRDDGGSIQFSAANYNVSESAGTVTLTVTRTSEFSGVATALYRTYDASATAPSDYLARSGTITFADQDSAPKTITIPIVNDGDPESLESIRVNMESISGARFGTNWNTSVSIADNDSSTAGAVQFDQAIYQVSEGTPVALITVTRSNGSIGAVSVAYASGGGSATPGTDYDAVSGVIDFAAGDTTPKIISITIRNDALVEALESIDLTLSTPTGGALLGARSTCRLYIINDDINSPPTIVSGPTATPLQAYVGQSVAFTVDASDTDGDPLTYSWNFGDSLSGSGASTSHAFATVGAFTATVTVSDGKGGSAQGAVTITVSPAGTNTVTITKAGTPLPGVYVYAYDAASKYLKAAQTNAQGRATFTGLATGLSVKYSVSDEGKNCWSPLVTTPQDTSIALPASTTVTVQKAGVPLSGVYVLAYTATGASLSYARTTNASGQAKFSLLPGEQVKFSVSSQGFTFWSAVVSPPATTTLSIPADTIVTVRKDGLPLTGVYVYAFDSSGTSLGYGRMSDASGKAVLAIAAGRLVKFRVSDQGAYFWSAVITAPGTASIDVPANTVVSVTKAGQPLVGVTVYAFNSSGVSLNYGRATNASGQAVFALPASTQVKFRVSDQGMYFWSPLITPPSTTSISLPANTTVTVQQNAQAVAGVNVYACSSDGTYLSYARTTNTAGQAIFALADGQQVKFKVTVNSQICWSTVITTPGSVTITAGPALSATLSALLSPPTASPSPGSVGQNVAFSAAASGSGELSYKWDFGDSTTSSGSSTSHIYTAPGTYNATVTISDGQNAETFSVAVMVNTSAGMTPESTLWVSKGAIKLNFARNSASLALSGFLPPGKALSGAGEVRLSFGDYAQTLSVDAKGRARTASASLKLSSTGFQFACKDPQLLSALAALGFVNADISSAGIQVPVTLSIGQEQFVQLVEFEYTAIKDRAGSGRK